MLNKSKELKAERSYVEPDSFVRLDGSEVLKGRDWEHRKHELFMRCHGRCEYVCDGFVGGFENISGDRCFSVMDDAHHKIARWPKRDDRLDNLAGLCRYHHRLLDKRKIGGRNALR